MQDSLRSSLESAVVAAFETSCPAVFQQMYAKFQKGIAQHTHAAQQQFGVTHAPFDSLTFKAYDYSLFGTSCLRFSHR